MNLDELQRLLDSATRAPWTAEDIRQYDPAYFITLTVRDPNGLPVADCPESAVPEGCHCSEGLRRQRHQLNANAALIAAMRNAMPALIARLRAADALRDAVAALMPLDATWQAFVPAKCVGALTTTLAAYDEVRNG